MYAIRSYYEHRLHRQPGDGLQILHQPFAAERIGAHHQLLADEPTGLDGGHHRITGPRLVGGAGGLVQVEA